MKITDEMIENGAIAYVILDTLETYGGLDEGVLIELSMARMRDKEFRSNILKRIGAVLVAAINTREDK